MRHLKDFKAMISEKTVPKSIKILKRTVIVLLLIICVLSAVEFSYRIGQKGDINEGVEAIYNSYMRHNIMADVNYISRYIDRFVYITYDEMHAVADFSTS